MGIGLVGAGNDYYTAPNGDYKRLIGRADGITQEMIKKEQADIDANYYGSQTLSIEDGNFYVTDKHYARQLEANNRIGAGDRGYSPYKGELQAAKDFANRERPHEEINRRNMESYNTRFMAEVDAANKGIEKYTVGNPVDPTFSEIGKLSPAAPVAPNAVGESPAASMGGSGTQDVAASNKMSRKRRQNAQSLTMLGGSTDTMGSAVDSKVLLGQ